MAFEENILKYMVTALFLFRKSNRTYNWVFSDFYPKNIKDIAGEQSIYFNSPSK